MAQSALTVTAPNPTPPTNIGYTGSTAPNPLNYDPTVYVSASGDPHYPRPELAPFYDDGTTLGGPSPPSGAVAGGTNIEFVSAHASLLVGGTSVEAEGRGTEVVVTATSANPSPAGQVKTCSAGPTLTATLAAGNVINPNALHASYLSAAVTPTITGVSAGGTAGPGTTLLTVTGTNYNRASVVNVNGVPQITNYVSPTTLTVTNAPKKLTSGTVPVTVTAGVGGVTTAATNWTFT